MTLPTLTFAYITDDTARALYGSFRPELWFAVEAFLKANPNWSRDLYTLTSDDIASAVHASARLAAITGQNDSRYSTIIEATAAIVEAWAIETTPSDLETFALSNSFELALFGTLVMPESSTDQVIEGFIAWKVKELQDREELRMSRSLTQDPSNIFSGSEYEVEYWSELCRLGRDLPGVVQEGDVDFNFDEIL